VVMASITLNQATHSTKVGPHKFRTHQANTNLQFSNRDHLLNNSSRDRHPYLSAKLLSSQNSNSHNMNNNDLNSLELRPMKSYQLGSGLSEGLVSCTTNNNQMNMEMLGAFKSASSVEEVSISKLSRSTERSAKKFLLINGKNTKLTDKLQTLLARGLMRILTAKRCVLNRRQQLRKLKLGKNNCSPKKCPLEKFQNGKCKVCNSDKRWVLATHSNHQKGQVTEYRPSSNTKHQMIGFSASTAAENSMNKLAHAISHTAKQRTNKTK